jgi:ribonucleoside-triphosphate reductase
MKRSPSVEEIQDMVENQLMNQRAFTVARNYITYRYKRALVRKSNSTDQQILSLLECNNEEVKQENSNKNPTVNSVQRDYMAGEVSKDITKRFLLPEDIVEAHEKGLIHFHDADYFAQHMHNCCLVNLEDMLQNGTVISETMIDTPKSFSTACNIATQAIAQIASSQYGGQSISLAHLAPFVEVSRKKFRKQVREEFEAVGVEVDEEKINRVAELRVKEEINRGVQMIQYQVITLMTTNGQAPFITVFMYLDEVPEGQTRADLAAIIEEMLHQRIQGVKNEKGVYITPAFPKLIYVLEEDNITEDSKYWYLTRLAAQCSAKRLVPDYISEKKMKELKVDKNGEGHCYTCMGCRSFLTPYVDPETNEPKYYGRFNQGVVTLNLVDVACSSGKDMDKFWEIMDERLELCYRALMCRHKRLLGTPSDVAPILWQNGALGRLEKGEPIDKLLFGGYSTISLGYAGLCECTRYMTGVSHTEPQKGTPFAVKVMQRLNDACKEWKEQENIDFSIYGTPLESTTYKFAKCLQKRFGIIEGVTDKNYITNSYHVHVTEEINAFDKLKFEAQFQALSPGGAISYVEVPNMQNNIDAVLSVMQYIYENIMYAELNTKSDYCMKCGYDGEIKIVEEEGSGKLIWECPNCGNHDQDLMSVARRTCGYIGTQFWNQGRTQEIKERVLHL